MNVFNVSVKVFLLFFPLLVQAEEAVAPTLTADPLGSAGKVAAFLVLILGLIFALAWLVNKTRVGQISGSNKQLHMLAMLPLGTKEKIAIIQAGEQQIVIGITPQNISTLSILDKPISVEKNTPASFSEILKIAAKR